MGKETIRGTAASPTIWTPIAPNPNNMPTVGWIKDDGLRGSPVTRYSDVPATVHHVYDEKGMVYADTFPNRLLAALGGPDTVTGTVAPFLHTIPLLNSAETGSQPPSYTLIDVDLIQEPTGAAAKQSTGAQLHNLDVDFAVTGAVNYTAQWIANLYTEVAFPAASFSTEQLIPAYSTTVVAGGIPYSVIEDGSLSIQRDTVPVFTIGSQSPLRNFAGPCDVTGKFTTIALAGDPTIINSVQSSKQIFTFLWTEPVSGHSFGVTMDSVQFYDAHVTTGKVYVEIETNFYAEANPTNAVYGYSPITATVTNAQQAAY